MSSGVELPSEDITPADGDEDTGVLKRKTDGVDESDAVDFPKLPEMAQQNQKKKQKDDKGIPPRMPSGKRPGCRSI